MPSKTSIPKEAARILSTVNHHLQTEVRTLHKQHGIELKPGTTTSLKVVRANA